MLNQVVLVGRLVKEAEILNVSEDKKKLSIVLAVPRSFKNSNGIYETDFIRCTLWNGIASRTKEFCHAGDLIGLKGRIATNNYTKEDGTTQYVTEVVAEKVTFLTSKSES